MKTIADSKTRFSKRVDDYAKWRPSYPVAAVDALFKELGLNARSSVADVGSGTGIMTRLLAGRVACLYAVEPNQAMRAVAERDLSSFPSFRSVAASAEETTLPDAAVELVLCAQAFHWFDRSVCKREFARILKPGGSVALLWNRRAEDTAFGSRYEDLLKRHCPDYGAVNHKKLVDADFAAFFREGVFNRLSFPSAQRLDFEGLLGRSVSSSYAPARGSAEFKDFEGRLRNLFDEFNQAGAVEFLYHTELIWGKP